MTHKHIKIGKKHTILYALIIATELEKKNKIMVTASGNKINKAINAITLCQKMGWNEKTRATLGHENIGKHTMPTIKITITPDEKQEKEQEEQKA